MARGWARTFTKLPEESATGRSIDWHYVAWNGPYRTEATSPIVQAQQRPPRRCAVQRQRATYRLAQNVHTSEVYRAFRPGPATRVDRHAGSQRGVVHRRRAPGDRGPGLRGPSRGARGRRPI